MYRSWQVFLIVYSRCVLSEERDKLVAINGIRKLLSEANDGDLLYGLWRPRLIQELCWHRNDQEWDTNYIPYPRKWRAPTWSWASTNAIVHPSNIRHHTDCSEFQERVRVEAIHVDEWNSGELKHASLTLRGKLLYATCITGGCLEDKIEFICGSSSITGSLFYENEFDIILDNPDSQLNFRGDLVCLGMLSCGYTTKQEPHRYLEAPALIPRGEDQYERVGIVPIPDSCYDFYTANETKVEHSLVIV